VVFRNADNRAVTVPDHGGTDIARGTMRSIARQAGVDPEQLFGDKKRSRGRARDPQDLLRDGNPPPGTRGSQPDQSRQPGRESHRGRGQQGHRDGGRRGRGRGD
jgi:hypothetical protein